MRTAVSIVWSANSIVFASSGERSWLSSAMDTCAMAAAIFSGVTGCCNSNGFERFASASSTRSRSSLIPSRYSRISAIVADSIDSGSSASDAVMLFAVAAVAGMRLVSSAVGPDEVLAAAGLGFVGGDAAVEGDVASPINCRVFASVVSADAGFFESFFKAGHVSSFSPARTCRRCGDRFSSSSGASLILSNRLMVSVLPVVQPALCLLVGCGGRGSGASSAIACARAGLAPCAGRR